MLRVVAIDGPAGSGKTTVAIALAARLGLESLNTGSMYRAVALAVLKSGGPLNDEAFVVSVVRDICIRVEGDLVVVDDVDVTKEIRSAAVSKAVSGVSAVAGVRTRLVALQRDWVEKRGGGVLEGRDIGTVVFPDAAFKFYLTVHPAEAARRRALQENADADTGVLDDHSADGSTAARSLEEISADLARRNHVDTNRTVSPLIDAETASENALLVDTTNRTREQVIDLIIGHMKSRPAWDAFKDDYLPTKLPIS